MNRICRDCGVDSNEDPEDPAPGLCPDCYSARLNKITPQFMRIIEERNLAEVEDWLREVLVAVGGERPDVARVHARDLVGQFLIESLTGGISLN